MIVGKSDAHTYSLCEGFVQHVSRIYTFSFGTFMLEISVQKFIFAKSICLVSPDHSCPGKPYDALLVYIVFLEVPSTKIKSREICGYNIALNQEKFAVITLH